MTKIFLIVGAILGGLSVAMGAFGAHGLEGRLNERALQNWETAARYQMYHALALLAVAWLSQQVDHVSANVAGFSFITGVLIFSGSLYVLSFTGIRWLGAITPIGGIALLVGWTALAFAASKLV